MRLIEAKTLQIKSFTDQDIPPYAILSHTWGGDEVTFDDWNHVRCTADSAGFAKIQAACRQTLKDNIEYVWADTVCIDKSSSAELSEAINSMYAWYRDAQVCYVYLSDVDAEDAFEKRQFHSSRWFTRGWTLQELLAPKEVIFYASDWTQIGTRRKLALDIACATRIPRRYLTGSSMAQMASISMKMSWISKRQTTRIEDMAYSMLGLFDINMSLLYGEGRKAFIRLQKEILKVSPDHTLFCWSWKPSVPANWVSLLAPAPDVFEHTGDFSTMADRSSRPYPYMMTNFGLSITLPIIQCWSFSFVVLSAAGIEDDKVTCIPVKLRPDFKFKGIYERTAFPPGPVLLEQKHCGLWRNHIVRSLPNLTPMGIGRPRGIQYGDFDGVSHGFLLMFKDIAPFMDKESPIYARCMQKKKYRVVEKLRIQGSVPLLAYPPGSFDESASLFTLEVPHRCSGILRIGGACIVYFSIRQSKKDSSKWLPYCAVLSHATWTAGQHGQSVLDSLDQTLQPASTISKPTSPLFSIQIGDKITVADPKVCVWPAYASGTRNMSSGDECYDSFQESDWSLEDS